MMHISYHVSQPFSRHEDHICQYAKWTGSESTLQWKRALVVRFITYHQNAGTDVTHRMVQLQPNTEYVYKCMQREDLFHFHTGDYLYERKQQPSKFLLLGDFGSEFANSTVRAVTNRVRNESVDAVLLVGDISYADIYNCSDYEMVFDEFMNEMEPVMATHPFMVCPGNHEYACKNGDCFEWTKDFVPYNAKFTMIFDSGKIHNMWYSFVWRNVQVISISTETDYPLAPFPSKFGDQLSWFEDQLKKANENRDQVPFVLVMGHRPIYSSHKEYSTDGVPIGSARKLQMAIEDLLYKYQVDLYVCGHVHSYERTYPTYQNKRNPQGTIHAVIGHAGNPEGPTKEDSYAHPVPQWSANHFTKDLGYVTLETTQDYMLWKMFASGSDTLADEIKIPRKSL
eukprot:CAMPEP_0117443986 /NCGR_PEP_ID=MMETSP0759-20121206/4994_1 /TAXON_ID=63605 /ORGANISM="Percolomonas cosmopolitus, Strain WS" /LENGTH=396 /DNA_ID=CAMNT_0005236011 /DNA_START=218 /DNA_END=1408 /DNA_ORIENTATION=+